MRALIDSTPAPEAIALRLRRDYALKGELSAHFWVKSRACLYDVRAGTERYLFKLLYRGEMGSRELGAQLKVLDHLRTKGVAVQGALRNRRGEGFIRFRAPEGPRLGVLFHWVPGLRAELGSGWRPRLHGSHGALIARFHQAASDLPATLPLSVLDLDLMLDDALAKMRPWLKALPGAHARFQKSAAWARNELERLPRNGSTWGVVHGDAHGGNAHFLAGRAALIDTEQVAYGWRIYDVATNFWGKAHGIGDPAKLPDWARPRVLAPFIDAYQRVRPLSPLERRCIPAMMVAREFWLNRVFCDWAPMGGDHLFDQGVHLRRSLRFVEGIKRGREQYRF